MTSIRSFIAVEIPRLLRVKLADLPKQAGEIPSSIRWVSPDGIHLTLKFLGNIHPELKDPIADEMRKAVKDIGPFPLRLTDVGAFPNENRPRVIWMGVRDDSGRLLGLQGNLEKGLQRLRFSQEGRKFTPHLTLARVRPPFGKGVLLGPWISSLRSVSFFEEEPATILVDRFYLMRSELRPTGAIYSVLDEVLFPEENDKSLQRP